MIKKIVKKQKKILTERFVSTFCIFPVKIFTDFCCCYLSKSDYFRISLWYYKEHWLMMSLILPFCFIF